MQGWKQWLRRGPSEPRCCGDLLWLSLMGDVGWDQRLRRGQIESRWCGGFLWLSLMELIDVVRGKVRYLSDFCFEFESRALRKWCRCTCQVVGYRYKPTP